MKEVEKVRSGMKKLMEGEKVVRVEKNRKEMRFEFNENFEERI